MSAPKKIAIFGATSDIATAVARVYAEAGAHLVLVGRDQNALDLVRADLDVRGALQVIIQTADFMMLDQLLHVADAAWQALGGLDIALIAYGSLPDQAAAQMGTRDAADALALNFTSPALLAGALASKFEAARQGTIVVLTSVAGDRGRQSNYVYGGAKGGLQRLLEGLRHRLAPTGAKVLDVRPGFVATKMTAHLTQDGPLWATPDKIAADIVKAVDRSARVLYTPWFWRPIMMIVRTLPRFLIHRTKL